MEENKKKVFRRIYTVYQIWTCRCIQYNCFRCNLFLLNTVILPGVWIVASVVSWVISVLWAYFMQNIFVFKEDKNKEHRVWWQTLIKTYMTYAFTGLILNNILLFLWVNVIDIAQYSGAIISFLQEYILDSLGMQLHFQAIWAGLLI